MKFRFLPEASDDLRKTIEYYEDCQEKGEFAAGELSVRRKK